MLATGDAVIYERLEPVTLKGKAEPVPVWRVMAVESAVGERRVRTGSPFVGRATELELLQRVYLRALAEPGFQLVTLVGEPGIGKSRLIAEFVQWVQCQAEAVALHRGQCLAYGDGVGLWPLAEIVKSITGITGTDDVAAASGKLDVCLRAWRTRRGFALVWRLWWVSRGIRETGRMRSLPGSDSSTRLQPAPRSY